MAPMPTPSHTVMQPGQTILVPLAEGFEEIEAVTIIDVLRRADLDVTVAGLEPGPVRGAHGVTFDTDCPLSEIESDRIHMLVLPGGMPGTTNLQEDERILALLRELHGSGRPVAAICAAPMVLATAGLLDGCSATSHPTVRDRLGSARVVDDERVVRAGTVVTSQGPGTSLEFALELVSQLAGPEKARELAEAMLVRR